MISVLFVSVSFQSVSAMLVSYPDIVQDIEHPCVTVLVCYSILSLDMYTEPKMTSIFEE